MKRIDGKVALITGAARGQGRSHAIRLAEEGADIVALDIGSQIGSVVYDMPGTSQLDETVDLVKKAGGRGIAFEVDVRDEAAMRAAVSEAVDEFGRLDIVCANAGILSTANIVDMSPAQWRDSLDVNLTGVWHTIRATAPQLIRQGEGGSMILTNSVAGLRAGPHNAAYVAAKHGLIGLMRGAAHELGPHSIRVNCVHPTSCATEMVHNEVMSKVLRPDLENPTVADTIEKRRAAHLLPIPWIEPIDISNAVLFLASDEARYVTGSSLVVDAGATIK
jgi:(+)-trans-carveol dehydrogenase